MKTQVVVVFAALLLLTTLIAESNCWHVPFPNGKRKLKVKVWNTLASYSIENMISRFRLFSPLV